MPAVLDVDPDVYVCAGRVFLRANADTCDLVDAAASAAGEGAGMAGTDGGGVDWARVYDRAAGPALAAGAVLVDSLGHVGELLDRTAGHHAAAETASMDTAHGTIGPPSYAGGGSTAPGAVAITVSAPPSADGTGDDPPFGWSVVGHLLQYTWPNGHQDRLRAVGAGWTTAADTLDPAADRLTVALTDVSGLTSPEVDLAVATCADVQAAARDLAGAYRTLGGACRDYAGYLDRAHADVVDELAEFAAESAGTQILAAVLAAPTVGASELAGQSVQLARTAATAARISRILQHLLEVVAEVTTRIEPIVTHVQDVHRRLQAVLDQAAADAATVRAVAEATPAVPVVDLPAVEGTGSGRLNPHTIERHVGKDDRYLIDRDLPYAGTFPDLPTAEWATTQNLVLNEDAVDQWIDNADADPVKRFHGPLPGWAGRIFDRKSGQFITPTRIRTTLMRTATGYVVLTSFPEP